MRVAVFAVVAAVYVLHQDFWLWYRALPLVFGVLPIGLFYHVAYMIVSALLFWLLVTLFWPSHLDAADDNRK